VQFSGRDIFQQPDAAFALRRDRGGKLRICQMQGFKRQAVTIASIELLRQIHRGQFNLGRLHPKSISMPAV
jgi:hypothetical protein